MIETSSKRTFTVASDENLVALVNRATGRLVVISPGLRMPLAEAIGQKIRTAMPDFECVVMLDADPEVCRLGYGDFAALEHVRDVLAQCGREVRSQPGLRIGLVIADAEMLIFSPTPLLIEAGSTTVEQPNAIQLSAPPEPRVLAACGVSIAGETRPPEVGQQKISSEVMATTQASLEAIPPRRFDLARFERVFNYQMEFVELELEKFKLTTRKVPLPAEVLGLTDSKLQERFRNSFRMFDDKMKLLCEIEDPRGNGQTITLSEEYLGNELDRIRSEYSLTVKGFGRVVVKRNKAKLIDEVERLRGLLHTYCDYVQKNLDAEIAKTREALLQELKPRLREHPPDAWVRHTVDGKLSEDELTERLEAALSSAFEKVEEGFAPEIKMVFKAVTYETIVNDPDFHRQIVAKVGASAAKKLLQQWDAVRVKEGS